MSEIIKTEAIVLSKLDYRDTSKIANLFTEDFGKISVIIKGARSPKSKTGKIVDPLNHIRIVYYNKESRDLQLISDAESINYFPGWINPWRMQGDSRSLQPLAVLGSDGNGCYISAQRVLAGLGDIILSHGELNLHLFSL